MPPVVFSHGNSFPASTYRVVLDSLRNRGFEVDAIEKFGHDPKYPVTDNWPHLVQQLADFAKLRADRAGGPVFLIGHSLGGFLSLMCAALHPELARGVVLIDSPILGGWRANTLNVVKRTPLMKSISPGAISRKRKNSWEHREAVFEHFRSKKAFAKWDEQVLHDYIDHGTFDADKAGEDGRSLSFDRDVETAIYNTLPHNLGALLRAPAQVQGGLHRRAPVGRDEAGGHGDDRAGHQGPHRHDGRHAPLPDGKAAGNSRGHRSRAAQPALSDRAVTPG